MANEALTGGIGEVIRDTVYGAGADESVRGEIHRLRMRMETEIARESAAATTSRPAGGGWSMWNSSSSTCNWHTAAHFRISAAPIPSRHCRRSRVILIPEGEGDTLLNGYICLRRLENQLRIVHDYSMNDLGGSREYLDKLARRLGYATRGCATPVR